MHPQLQAIGEEFESAQSRLHRLAETASEAEWMQRPHPARWSIAECIGHLNLTAEAYLPMVRSALSRGPRLGRWNRGRYRRDPVGWLMWRMVGPPVRVRLKTAAAFIPSAAVPAAQLLAEFDRLQAEQVACVVEADGLRLGSIWITSPFDQRVRYNLYSCLTILPRHQHRHLWQAQRVLAELRTRIV